MSFFVLLIPVILMMAAACIFLELMNPFTGFFRYGPSYLGFLADTKYARPFVNLIRHLRENTIIDREETMLEEAQVVALADRGFSLSSPSAGASSGVPLLPSLQETFGSRESVCTEGTIVVQVGGAKDFDPCFQEHAGSNPVLQVERERARAPSVFLAVMVAFVQRIRPMDFLLLLHTRLIPN